MKFNSMLKDAITTKAYALRTFSSDPLQSFRFKVSIDGFGDQPISLGFKSVSGLSREFEVVEYLESMYVYTRKMPGRETVGEVTFERGMYADSSLKTTLYDKIKTDKRCEVTISICNRAGKAVKTFQLSECWFSGYEVADLDAESSDVIIETLTMQFEKFL